VKKAKKLRKSTIHCKSVPLEMATSIGSQAKSLHVPIANLCGGNLNPSNTRNNIKGKDLIQKKVIQLKQKL